MTRGRPFLLRLRGPIKTYAWGSRTVLARLFARAAPAAEPEAELWLGAHPQGVSEVASGGSWVSLRDAIERSPIEFLGAESVARYGGELPFLLKVLAIESPLSLQVHPDREQAAAGFERERAAGIAPEDWSYCDPRHKPELIVALEPLWLLRGLRTPAEIRRRFAEAGLASFERETERLAQRGAEGLRDFLAALLGLSGERRLRLLDEARHGVEGLPARSPAGAEASSAPTTDGVEASSAPTADGAEASSAPTAGGVKASAAGSADARAGEPRDHPRYWLARLLELHPEDPAALAPLFLHLARLSPGQGAFQPSRILHTYLEGAGVEVMASSDNVVRAGLTAKRVDVDAVLAVADVEPAVPSLIEPATDRGTGVARYSTPADEFELFRLDATAARAATLPDPTALLLGICTRGRGRLEAPDRGEVLDLSPGAAFAVRPGAGGLRVLGEVSVHAATVAPREARGGRLG